MKLSKLFPLVGIILFLLVLMNIDLTRLLDSLLGADVYYLILAVTMLFPIIIVKAVKWKFLINSYDVRFPVRNLIKPWLIGFSISMITPARLGDISRAYYLREKMSAGKGMTTVIIDRIIDVFVLFILSIVGILGFVVYAEFADLFTTIIIFFVLFLVMIYLSTKKGFMRSMFRPFFKKLVPERYKDRIHLTFNEFYKGMGLIRKRRTLLLGSILLGILSWFMSIFQHYLLALSLNLDVTYLFLLSVMPIVTLLDTLPISFSGLGTREVALIFFLSYLGIAAESIVSFSIILLIFSYISVGLLGFYFWSKKPIKINV